MSNGTKVKKRDGRIESLDLDKMHIMVDKACEGLLNFRSGDAIVELNA